ncbi:MAG: hypothetical protein ABSF77_13825 [Spirochaetia bacterium]|jgi:hypothetical protein
MALSHATAVRLLIGLALLFTAAGAGAADIVMPPPEAPTTIFSSKLGSVDVDLDLLGSWTAGVSFGTGLLFVPGLNVQLLDSFPSIDNGFIFSQTPDITVSLELLKRFYMNASIIGSFSDNSLQLGYKGAQGEALQSVVLGTADVTIAPSPLLQIPGQPLGSLGVTAQLASGSTTNDFLLRWDATKSKQKTFVGANELVVQEIGINEYIRGTYFFLPDVGLDKDSLQVLLEDPSGTYISGAADGSRKYRKATYDDVVLDSTLGLVSLSNPIKGRVLVYYTKGGSPVGATSGASLPKEGDLGAPYGSTRDPTQSQPFSWSVPAQYLGLDMTHRRVTIPGIGDCLLLWEPGDNSPFEIDNSYPFTSTPPSDASNISYSFNVKDVSASLPTGMIFQSDPPNKRFMFLKNMSMRATFGNFYPFSDPNGLLYGPNRDSLSGSLDFDIIVQTLNPVSDYTLEQNIVPGSVQVTVNGVAETRFEVEPISGKLTMLMNILPTDRIVVTYRTTEQGITGGDILLAWKDQIPLADWALLSLSAGVRWNADPWSYSQEPYEKSGTAIAAVGLEGKTDTLAYSVQAGVSYTNPDTSGILRLFGMEGASIALDLSEDNAYPASAPDASEIAGLTLTQLNRGKLWYSDYHSYGALGSVTLLPFETSPPPPQMPYANGYRMGPFNVLGSNGNLNAQNIVMEYSLDQTGTSWVGTQIPISSGSDFDLSTARSVTIRYRVPSQTGGASLYLQIGSISEDLDGSGMLKAESSSADAGFPFVDQAHSGIVLKVGAGPKLQGNGKLDTEDRNANSILDLEDANRIVTLLDAQGNPIQLSAGSEWQTVTFTLTDDERQKLLQTRGIRLIIAATGITSADEVSGTLIIDSLSIEGSPFWPIPTVATDRPDISVRQVAEDLSSNDPGAASRMDVKYPTTYALFHPNSETNEVLEILWGKSVSYFSVKGYSSQGTGGIQYQTIVSYVRSTTAGTTSKFSLIDATGAGIKWSVTAPDTAWHEVRVSSKAVTIDGVSAGSPTQFDASYGSLSFLQIDVPASSSHPGALYVDEVYGTDPAGAAGVALVGTFSAAFPGTLLSAGKVPLLSNAALREDVSLSSAGFSSLYGTPLPCEDLSSRTHAEADLLFTRSSVDLTLQDVGGTISVAGGHKIILPTLSSPLTLTDAFFVTGTGGFSREDSLALRAGPFLSLSLDTSANADADETENTGLLTQSWQAGLSLSPFSPLAITSTLSLSQTVADYTLQQEWYGARWLREAGLVLPWEEGADVTRKEQLGITAGIPAAPVGFSIQAEASADGSDYSTTGFTQENDLTLSLALLMKLGQSDSSDSLSVSYNRDLSLTTAPVAGPRFEAETDELARVLLGQTYILQAIPIAEVFEDNSGTVLQDWESASLGTYTQGTYSPYLDVALQRSYGARLLDLIIPSSIELAIGQDFMKTQELSQTVAYIRLKTTTRAVNLFGALGVYPFLPWVRTDEYSLSLSASVEGDPSVVPVSPVLATLSVEAYATFTGKGDNVLTLLETLKRDQTTATLGSPSTILSNDMQALLDWKVFPPGGVQLPYIAAEVGKTAHWENRESAEITIGYQDAGSFHPFTLVLGHATSLVYEKYGTIKASFNLGADMENTGASGMVWRLAVRAALEAKLSF